MKIITTVEEFKEFILNNDTVLVDFFATWCGPCKMLAPNLEEVSEQVETPIIKIDVDELPELARQYGIFSIPTLILIKNGKEVKRDLGFKTVDQLLSFLK
jgi:thioredoxin 1